MERISPSATQQRQAVIAERLRSSSFVSIQDLCQSIGISEATARRDLAELEAQGLLRRTHGGAVPVQQVTRDYSNAERLVRNAAEKARIATAAAAMVQDGDVVFLDAGTTTLQLAMALSMRQGVTFITNGADIFNCLAAAKVTQLFMVGGQYFEVIHGFSGPLAAEGIRRFTVDKAFLSVGAVDMARRTICISLPELAATQQAMIDVAQQVIVVADHSKFERAALSVIAPLDQIDCLITDSATRDILTEIPAEMARKIIFV